MFTRKMASLAVFAALSAASFATQAVVIDTFNGLGPGPSSTTTTPSANDTFTQTADAIGSWREVNITAFAPDGTGTNVKTNGAGAPGQLAVSNDTGYTSTTVLTWDNAGIGLGGLDLTAGGVTSLQLVITSIDVGNVQLTFDVYDGTTGHASEVLTGLTAGTQFFAFSGFSGDQSVFSNANTITLTIEATSPSADLSLDLVQTSTPPSVPEPATLSLLGVGLFGLIASRRKNRG